MTPAPLPTEEIERLGAAVAEWHSRVAKYKAAIREHDALSSKVKYASEKVSSAYARMTTLLVEHAPALLAEIEAGRAALREREGE